MEPLHAAVIWGIDKNTPSAADWYLVPDNDTLHLYRQMMENLWILT